MASSTPALSFDEMIQADRKKRAAENLAQSMLGSKKSGPGSLSSRKPATAGPGAKLASRVGVTKRSSSAQPAPKSHIDGKWGHDLHHVNNPQVSRTAQLSRTASSSDVERGSRIYSGIQRDISNGATTQATVRTGTQMSIRGKAKAGPFVVVASNFAPGTTAADIEAAMEPIGGEIQSCSLVSTRPTVVCEIIFSDKDGAQNAVETFNNQKADGRLLYVYHKQGGPTPHLHPLQTAATATTTAPAAAPTPAPEPPKGPRAANTREEAPQEDRDLMDVDDEPSTNADARPSRGERYSDRDRDRFRDVQRERDRDRNGYTDGRYGFREPYNRQNPPRDFGRGRGPRGLYSDSMRPNDRQYRP